MFAWDYDVQGGAPMNGEDEDYSTVGCEPDEPGEGDGADDLEPRR